MLVKNVLRLNNFMLCFNSLSFYKKNSLSYQRRYFFQKSVFAPSAVLSESSECKDKEGFFSSDYYRNYVLKNSNFKNPVCEIISLNFSPGNKESLKLLFQLKENFENNTLWQETLECLIKELSIFDVDDFLKSIALASALNKSANKNEFLPQVIVSIENALQSRKFQFDDILEILFVLKHTLHQKSLKKCNFYLKACRKIQKLHKLDPHQVVIFFFFLEKFSEVVKPSCSYPIIKFIETNISVLNADEIGIILRALMKIKIYICKVDFIKQLTNKILEDIDNINSLHLYTASKYLVCCSSANETEVILNYQEKLIPHLSRFDPKAVISTLLSGYPFSLNLSLWGAVVEKVKGNLRALPLMHIERMVAVSTSFKVKDEEFLKIAVKTVENMNKLEESFPYLVLLCRDLAIHKIYPRKLLDIVLSKNFFHQMMSRSLKKEIKQWWFLNCTLIIDKPEYQCAFVDEIIEKKIRKKIDYEAMKKKDLHKRRIEFKILGLIKTIYGDDKVVRKKFLSHYDYKLVMRFDENLEALPIPEEYIMSKNSIQKPLDSHFWLALNIYSFVSEHMTPYEETYVRQLIAVGYKPVIVPKKELMSVMSCGEKRSLDYLVSLITAALQELVSRKGN